MNDKSFKVYIKSKRGGSEPIVTTAAYDPNSKKCYIYGKERATVDVCRSIAHEMTHMMQDEMGLLVGHIQDAGGFHEDQANSKAGELIKLFAKSKEARKSIYESRKIKTKTDSNKGKFININNFLLVNLSIKKPDIIKVNTDKVE